MTISVFGIALMGTGLFLSGATGGRELPGRWILSVENPEHVVVATLEVEFTDERARSCRGGEWKVVKVVSSTTRDEDFFPMSDPLSYQIEGDQLTMGRNELCDAYLSLKGSLGGSAVSGEYSSLGLGGGAPLGYFELNQAR